MSAEPLGGARTSYDFDHSPDQFPARGVCTELDLGVPMRLRFFVALAMLGSAAVAQTLPKFQDDLLDQLVGKWTMSGQVHGRPSNQTFVAQWVLNHQFLEIRETSAENVAGMTFPFEAVLYIGYDRAKKQYVLHSLSVFGSGRPGEFVYGQRNGNTLEFSQSIGAKSGRSRFTWDPQTKTWHYIAGLVDEKGVFTPSVELTSATSSPPAGGSGRGRCEW